MCFGSVCILCSSFNKAYSSKNKIKYGTSFRLFGNELAWQVSFVNNKNKNKAY
jgi:hypothetical protein